MTLEIDRDTVELNDGKVRTEDPYALDHSGPTIIRAFLVTLTGMVASMGNDVVIHAQTVSFGPDGLIDTSGADAPKTWQAGSKPIVPSERGKIGAAGASGIAGTSAGSVRLYAGQVTGTVRVRAVGGSGGRGQDGGDGAKGADADQRVQKLVDTGARNATGPAGGKGGQGGTAGAPGKSGPGGDLDLWLPPGASPPIVQAELSGGSAPDAAVPGQPGGGGLGGPAPQYWRQPQSYAGAAGHHVFPGHAVLSGSGNAGAVGGLGEAAAAQATRPAKGMDGRLNGASVPGPAPPHLLTDADLAAGCRMDQLWAILQVAEVAYYNDRVADAVPRLEWVARTGRLLARGAAP